MDHITVTLQDGSKQEHPAGITPLKIAESIGKRLAKAAIAAKIDGNQVDITRPLTEDCRLEIITVDSDEGKEILRHSTSHLMAQAVEELFPSAQIAIGPAIENGFYYDIAVDGTFSEDDLVAIEDRMQELAQKDIEVEREVRSIDELISLFSERNEKYKIELLEEIRDEHGDDKASIYWQNDFVDLCRGPHAPSTGWMKHFKLLNVAGAYWRGDEQNEMLQRIYGTSWPSKKELEEHLHFLEEAKERDHRKLGKELDLFSFHTEAPANPFFHANGTIIYNQLVDHMRDLYRKYDYNEVITPQILDVDLWHKSGHYENYRDNMYFTSIKDESRDYAVKPMNCPTHAILFGSTKHSYRDLPLRIADFGRLHRYERGGVTHGLTRVRTFAQDDAHVFCTFDQIEQELHSLVKLILETYELFDFRDVKIEISTRPEKYIGEVKTWDKAEEILKVSLDDMGYDYEINEGDGAFYGPKIDFIVRDALRREWQLGTVQLDFMMPERFDLTYTAATGSEERPVMIHRAVLGSVERFIGILIEHTGGDFPLWIAPKQMVLLPIADRHEDRAYEIKQQLQSEGIRVDVDDRNEGVSAKIRDAELQKIPYMGIIGDNEINDKTVSLREHTQGDLGVFPVEEVKDKLLQEIKNKEMRK
ncbi:MAG: threonine--tRNA ligase [Candidatus Marinimicrobia bacterium]|nr:threonine--tRNA ligase [Candidatus Neomarinimicrobiota bacterium]